MAKKIKLDIKNSQLAKALNVKKSKGPDKAAPKAKPKVEPEEKPPEVLPEQDAPPPVEKKKVKARTRSAFAPTSDQEEVTPPVQGEEPTPSQDTPSVPEAAEREAVKDVKYTEPAEAPKPTPPPPPPKPKPKAPHLSAEKASETIRIVKPQPAVKYPPRPRPENRQAPAAPDAAKETVRKPSAEADKAGKKRRDVRDTKPKQGPTRPFNARDARGLSRSDEGGWRRRRVQKSRRRDIEDTTIRPSELSVRLPISVKELAAAMKLKASQLVQKLFLQGMVITLNDILDDETVIQLLGHEFGCEITVDTSEEKRIRITDQSVIEEIQSTDETILSKRGPIVTFMGHVDHGKTSLIDRIRKSNIVSGESGAITQHIGAFCAQTEVGPLTILDTPGHEAFTAMRARGADVTDVVVLVVAGDEGIRPQTLEAVQHAKVAGVAIIVAINKCDKPNFDAENVYRQLSEVDLLPEKWGGEIVTVNCSAVSGEGIEELLEMIALQSEVLELRADPTARARGRVVESEMHKGLGAVATVLVQNGTLSHGDAVVFDDLWGRVKTMKDEFGKDLKEALPGTPVSITGLSGLPAAGSEFIVVPTEKEAREIAQARMEGSRQKSLAKKKIQTMEHLFQEAAEDKKVLRLILRADVQGSLEALKNSLIKIESDKARIEVIFSAVGSISESDVELAMASEAVIVGFHSQVESHAEPLIKSNKVKVILHDVIYHAIDEVRDLLTGTLEKVAEERPLGKVEVRATFKASQLGVIAGCYVTEGVINKAAKIRQHRDGEVIWQGGIASIKREQEDVKEVRSGYECGIVLQGRNDIQDGDIFEAYQIVYVEQQL